MRTVLLSNRAWVEDLSLNASKARYEENPSVTTTNLYGITLMKEEKLEEAFKHWRAANLRFPDSAKVLGNLLCCVSMLPGRGMKDALDFRYDSMQRVRLVDSEEIPDIGGLSSQSFVIYKLGRLVSEEIIEIGVKLNDVMRLDRIYSLKDDAKRFEEGILTLVKMITPILQDFKLQDTKYRDKKFIEANAYRDVPTMEAECEFWHGIHDFNFALAFVGNLLSFGSYRETFHCPNALEFPLLEGQRSLEIMLSWVKEEATTTMLSELSGGYWTLPEYKERFIDMRPIRFNV